MTAPALTFRRAERTAARLKIGIQGPSGSGKTEGALILARAIAGPTGRVALIDTENDSASLYADRFDFDTLNLAPPYLSKRYQELIDLAVSLKYDVLVIDTISQQWAGEGGILARKEAVDARGGNSFTNWSQFTPEHEAFKAKLLNAPIHIIATLRTKQDYVMETTGNKTAPKKVGLAAVQREGMEYEFTIMFELQMDHRAAASKDRTTLYDKELTDFRDKASVQRLIDWHRTAKPVAVAPTPAPAGPVLVKDEAAGFAISDLDWALAYPHPQNGVLFGSLDTVQLEELVAWATTQIKRAEDKGQKPSVRSTEIRKAAKLIVAERERAAVFADEADDDMPGTPAAAAPAAVEQPSLLPEAKKEEPKKAAKEKQLAADSIYERSQRLNHLLNSPSVSDGTKAELRPSILTKGAKNTAANVAWFDTAIERVEEEILASGGSKAPVATPATPAPADTRHADELIAAAAGQPGDDGDFPL